jgi:hypothetical protein
MEYRVQSCDLRSGRWSLQERYSALGFSMLDNGVCTEYSVQSTLIVIECRVLRRVAVLGYPCLEGYGLGLINYTK